MINIKSLKEGNIVRTLINLDGHGMQAGDTMRVVKVGYSGWDRMYYADCKTDKGYDKDIYDKDYKDYELVC